MRLERDREMGISVYAPGSEIVADGHLLRSGAVWFNSKEPDVRFYTRCPQCRKISIYLETQQPANICDRCGTAVVRPPKRYIKPDAFSTLAEDNVQEPGLYRRRPPRNSDVFLLEGAEDFADHLIIPGVSFGIRRNGKMFRANSGHRFAGFKICRKCGISCAVTAKAQKLRGKLVRGLAEKMQGKCKGTFLARFENSHNLFIINWLPRMDSNHDKVIQSPSIYSRVDS